MISVRFERGLFLPDHDLWLDPWDPQPRAFVSHAHADHIGAHAEIVASHGTARLMRERLPPGAKGRVEHLLELGETRTIYDLPITLLAAGHIFGSAQFFTETDTGSLLYTGDFKMRPGLSAESISWCHAETLIMETTFGLPKYRFPPTAEVLARMVAFCQEALEENCVPVLLGYSLGKAQEILCALAEAGLQPMLHASVARMTGIYRELNPDFPSYEPYAAGQIAGKVLICPPSVVRSHMLRKITNRRVAVLTGWALDSSASFRYGCDAAFPLSDHADYDDLVRYVELVNPKRVLTLHGFAEPFARDLRQRGFEAWALGRENQMDLSFAGADFIPPTAVSAAPEGADSPFAAFAALGEAITATASKLRKIELLAAYLRTLAPEDLPAAAIWLTGRAFPQNDPRVLHTGSAVIRRALLGATAIPEAQLREISRRHADAGKTASEALTGRTQPQAWTLAAIRALFESLEQARGPIAKADLLQTALAKMSAPEGSYVVKILTGDLRIGLKEGLVEEAIAKAFETPIADVREAAMLLGDLGHTATLASTQRLAEADLKPFQPIQVMLASPEPTAVSLWTRITETGAATAWLEDKFDGIRAQLHVATAPSPLEVSAAPSPRVEIYSRDLKCITDQFNELATAARTMTDEVIFDGEITAFEHGRALTFFDLQKRLGRKDSADFFLGAEIPVRFVAFDLLWHNGESLLKQPLSERRRRLEAIALPPKFMRIDLLQAQNPDEIERAFTESRARGNEGLIAKNPQSLYTPGRRGQAWLKLKKELATLDVVVVGAENGHGKRAGVLSDYTFAVRDDATGRLLTIGKAYSGLTDVEIDLLTEHFTEKTLRQRGRYREVEPDTVLEIAFDSVQPSTRHESGLALRFPRIKAIRRDKSPSEIDTLSFARKLVATAAQPPN